MQTDPSARRRARPAGLDVQLDVRLAEQRPVHEGPGRRTRHSFSFGPHYDPANLGFGALVAHAEDVVRPGGGYPLHRHADTEIVTVVLHGALTHAEPDGRRQVLGPGAVQALSAGSGFTHAETVEPGGPTTRFVQAWVRPTEPGGPPSWAYADPAPVDDGWVPLASGLRTDAVLPLRAAATMYAARLSGTATGVALPDAPRLHLFVATGQVRLAGRMLSAGDAARLTDRHGRSVSAGDVEVVGGAAELLLWELR